MMTRRQSMQERYALKMLKERKERGLEFRPAKPRKSLRKQSKARARETALYYAAFPDWVAKPGNAQCAACLLLHKAGEVEHIALTTERHHRLGRNGKLLNWEPGWIPSCRFHREWFHAPQNRERAEQWGLIGSRTEFNRYPDEIRNAV